MKKFLAFILACATLLCLVACGGKEEKETGESVVEASKQTEPATQQATEQATEESEPVKEEDAAPLTIYLDKISTVKKSNITTSNAGLYYKDESGKYGIISLDGKSDTGAKYVSVETVGDFFVVSTKEQADKYANPADHNRLGLVNGKGKMVLKEEYAMVEKLSDRYYQVAKVTGRTYDKNQAIMYIYEGPLKPIAPGTSDVLLAGEWYIYDAKRDRIVPNLVTSASANITAEGEIIKYKNNEGQWCYADDNGTIKGNHSYFNNGSYVENGALYASYGAELFKFGERDYIPHGSTPDGKHYYASKTVNGLKKTVILDENGNVISAVFNGDITTKGKIVLGVDKVYDLQGNALFDQKMSMVHSTGLSDKVYILSGSDFEVMLDVNGTVYYRGSEVQEDSVGRSSFVIKESMGNYYCYKDRNYTLKGIDALTWSIKVENEEGYLDLVSVSDGSVLVSDCHSLAQAVTGAGEVYIYAKQSDGTWDVYQMKAA